MDYELDKQRRIITKDWTGERNAKIYDAKFRLVNKMAKKLNKPRVAAIST